MTQTSVARNTDVVVVGAGVVGLSTAVCLAEAGLKVRVDTSRPPWQTTSAAAGAAWDPYLAEPTSRALKWSLMSLEELTRLTDDPAETGVRWVEGTQESRVPCSLPFWASAVEVEMCAPEELHPGFETGWRLSIPIADAPAYLRHLIRRFERAGGRVCPRTYTSLTEAVVEAPIVVNCTGSGARTLVPDAAVQPLKGQVVVVRNPGVDRFFCDDTPDSDEYTYFYPHDQVVTLGGSQQPDSTTMVPDEAAAEAIVRRCGAVEPLLLEAAILDHRVGLRPVRPEVCLEVEELPNGHRLAHNYGHGGAGFSLAWGCAVDLTAKILGADSASGAEIAS
ncbi:NAD(P)/FAD-dependent oxidoreductase [Yinghuangia sp. YIM S09857]|uniref:NAD(P)/FAD-dependent oxidoreductase n=1 Tax=Yinghuangia sp. YIM S09857 TaxID=3436929 RepID=UPI003F538718